jgi:hypothetical protein
VIGARSVESSELLLPALLCTRAGKNSGEAGCDFKSEVPFASTLHDTVDSTATFGIFGDGEGSGEDRELFDNGFAFDC